MTTEPSTREPAGRPERSRGRGLETATIVGAIVLVIVNAGRLSDAPFLRVLLFATPIVLFLVWLGVRTRIGKVKDLESLEQLSEVVSNANREQRYILGWYEYAIVRNVERGTYSGERPAQFKRDVYELVRRMGQGTRYSFRLTRWALGVSLIAAMMLTMPMGGSQGSFPWALVIMLAIGLAPVIGITAIFMWWMSRRPMSLLGRRVEDASTLPTGPRLEALSQIARDEFALASA